MTAPPEQRARRAAPAPHAASGVTVRRDGTVLTVTVTGQLDANSGVELLAGVQSGTEGATRVDVDLLGIVGHTPEGARSLKRARSLAARLQEGLHFRIGPGACQDALLEAFADDGDGHGAGPLPA